MFHLSSSPSIPFVFHVSPSIFPILDPLSFSVLNSSGDADWSDFALWWPDKQIWLNKPRQTLYAYGIMSNAKLEFVPVHRHVTVELPDKQQYQVRVNFAVMTFLAVAEICQELSVRHPEELSLLRSPRDKEGYMKLTGYQKKGRKVSREGTPGREVDSLSVDSGDILGTTPPASPARRRKLPTLALPANQRQQSDLTSHAIATHIGEAGDGSFFSEKLHRTMQEKTYINGL